MSLFSNLFKKDNDTFEGKELLEALNNSIAVSANNTEKMTEVLSRYIDSTHSERKVEEETEEERIRAAYALNLCTVSISQIIEYNDINFMEREYDAILNNLNLENMPKDEALLSILKQLLDVITYFRIENQEKQLLDKKYERRMKDAIWSAIPNFSVVASSNPLAIAVSLATQIGTGYMNYRKAKAQIALEEAEDKFRLQKSAMEQFNGLRRELFDTAWRLSKEHKFSENYRITERQISQYNRILLDTNNLRKYERLCFIKNKFEAYPPFLYYLGSAANAVSNEREAVAVSQIERTNSTPANSGLLQNLLSSDSYKDVINYKREAIKAFNEFLLRIDHNILREDLLASQCALEFFDLLDEKDFDKYQDLVGTSIDEKRKELLSVAVKYSAGALDVLQLCAMSCLRINDTQDAEKWLQVLVNEGYNIDVNAQVLSKIYAEKAMRSIDDFEHYAYLYDKLSERTSGSNVLLYPRPENTKELASLEKDFLLERKNQVKALALDKLSAYVKKCEDEYNRLSVKEGRIDKEVFNIICSIERCVEEIVPFYSRKFKNSVEEEIQQNNLSGSIANGLSDMSSRNHGKNSIQLYTMIGNSVEKLGEVIGKEIAEAATEGALSAIETRLMNCEYGIYSDCNIDFHKRLENIVFDETFKDKSRFDIWRATAKKVTADAASQLIKPSEEKKPTVKFYGENQFDFYFKSKEFKTVQDSLGGKDDILGVIEDKRVPGNDLVISIRGLAIIKNRKGALGIPTPKKAVATGEYSSVIISSVNSSIYIRANEHVEDFNNNMVEMPELVALIEKLIKLYDDTMGHDPISLSSKIQTGIQNNNLQTMVASIGENNSVNQQSSNNEQVVGHDVPLIPDELVENMMYW